MKHPLLLLLICCGLCTAVSARPIRGTVKCGGKPLGGRLGRSVAGVGEGEQVGADTVDKGGQIHAFSMTPP